jgi:hypothetical protein
VEVVEFQIIEILTMAEVHRILMEI